MSDLIRRQDAIGAVHTYFRTQLAESGGEWNDELQEYVFSKEDKRLLTYNKGVSTAIKALPSAEAVQGEWVRKYDDEINCYWYECDQCGEYRPRNQFGHEYNANFCPNCGARMTPYKGGDNE